MFRHLQEIDYKLYERYLTLEKNIKAGSNSFYDAYLDLQEQFIKDVAVFCEFDIKARETCGELLRRDDVKNFFKEVLCVDDFTYTKMQDYTLKVNAHKHKGEKNIQIDTIVSYMRIIYNATVSFANYKKILVDEFDANYFISIFGAFEKENSTLKVEMAKLKEELLVSVESGKLKDSDIIAYKSLLSQSELDNPFSGCTKLEVENHSPYYHFENGVIYNKFKTTIIGCLNGSQIDELVIPETVTSINRNAFWNCKGIKKVVITKNIVRIGYNPFASAENMYLKSESPEIISRDGILYDKTMSNLLCATNRAVGKSYRVPDSIKIINRGVFSGCKDLEQIDFNAVTYIDKSSFTNCTSLKEVYIPDSVTYIGEWVFSYCKNLKKISINKNTFVDKNAFNECPAEIIWRD